MTAYPAQTRTIVRRPMGLPITAGCDLNEGLAVTPLALRCSALDRWATPETQV